MDNKYTKLTLSIPIPVDKPNANGYCFTKNAVVDACEKLKDLPIIDYNDNEKVIGIAKSAEYFNGFIFVDSIFYEDISACEEFLFEYKNVTSLKNIIFTMEIASMGMDN